MSFRNLFGSQVNEQTAQRLPLAAFGLRQNDEASIKERTERARRDQKKQREDAAQAEAERAAVELATKQAERAEGLEIAAETEQRLAAAHNQALRVRFSHMLTLHKLQTASNDAIVRHLEKPDDAAILVTAQEAASALWLHEYTYVRRVITNPTSSPIPIG